MLFISIKNDEFFIFLHFLQKKGWLCGDTNFMLNTFSQSNRRSDYLESVLEPLFFGILNTEPAKREQVFSRNGWQQGLVEKWASIPYFNGGLFERDNIDDLRIILPEKYFFLQKYLQVTFGISEYQIFQ